MREAPLLASTLNCVVPGPVPLAPDVTVIHGTSLLASVGTAAVGGYLSGDNNALRNGVFEGALGSVLIPLLPGAGEQVCRVVVSARDGRLAASTSAGTEAGHP